METGVPNSEVSSEASAMNSLQAKQAFQAKMKSFEENDLGTINETVAILEPPREESSGGQDKDHLGSHQNLMLTVNMPYGAFLGHEVPVSKSQPNLKVTVSIKDNDQIVSSVTRMTSTTDLFNRNQSDDDCSDDCSVSSCSAGSNSSCSSSFDENCPHCVISVNSKGTFTGDEEPIFL